MNATVDPDLLKLVQQHVNTLKTDVEQLTFEVQEDKKRVTQALKDILTSLEELEARVASVQHEQEVMKQKQSLLSKTVDALQSDVDTRVVSVQHEQEVMKQEQSSLSIKVDAMQTDLETLKLLQQEDVQRRVTHMEKQRSSQSCPEENQDRGIDILLTSFSG